MALTNFIIEEFEFYKVFLYGRNVQGEKTDYGIHMNIPSGNAILRFTRDYTLENYCEEKNGKKTFYVFLRVEKYPSYIDIMRYEKPLFFFYDFDSDESYVTTSDEPVGEEEHSAD